MFILGPFNLLIDGLETFSRMAQYCCEARPQRANPLVRCINSPAKLAKSCTIHFYIIEAEESAKFIKQGK